MHPKTQLEFGCSNRKIGKRIEIEKAEFNKNVEVLNRDEGNQVKINTWTPLFANVNEIWPSSWISTVYLTVIKNISRGVLYLV